jgi:hypothetical protein
MSQVLEDSLPPPKTGLEYTKWNPGEQGLGEREISQGDEGEFEHLDTL